MKKRLFVSLILIVILSTLFVFPASADEKLVWPSYNRHDLTYTEGTVISHNASMRVEPNENSTRICSVYNGQQLKIIGSTGNWYIVDLSCLDNPKGHTTGYIFQYYVEADYVTLYLRESAPIYPYAGANKRIGYLSAGTFYTLLGETNNYWIINARTCAAYVSKNTATYLSTDMEFYYDNYQIFTRYVTANTTKVYSGPGTGWNHIGTLNKNEAVAILWKNDNWYAIRYDDDGAQVIGYVRISHVN